MLRNIGSIGGLALLVLSACETSRPIQQRIQESKRNKMESIVYNEEHNQELISLLNRIYSELGSLKTDLKERNDAQTEIRAFNFPRENTSKNKDLLKEGAYVGEIGCRTYEGFSEKPMTYQQFLMRALRGSKEISVEEKNFENKAEIKIRDSGWPESIELINDAGAAYVMLFFPVTFDVNVCGHFQGAFFAGKIQNVEYINGLESESSVVLEKNDKEIYSGVLRNRFTFRTLGMDSIYYVTSFAGSTEDNKEHLVISCSGFVKKLNE